MKKLRSIQTELTLIFLGLVGFLLILGVIFLYNLSIVSKNFEDHIENQMPTSLATQQVLVALEGVTGELSAAFRAEDITDIQIIRDSEANFNKNVLNFEMFAQAVIEGSDSENFKRLDGGIIYREWILHGFNNIYKIHKSDEANARLMVEVDALFDKLVAKSERAFQLKKSILRLHEQGETHEEQHAELDEVLSAIKNIKTEMGGKITQMVEFNTQTSEDQHQHVSGIIMKVELITYTSLILSMIFAIMLGYFVAEKLLIIPITKLQKGSREIASGNFNYEVSVENHDELGTLAKGFNQMASQLKARDIKIRELTSTLKVLNKLLRHDLLNDLTIIQGNLEMFQDMKDKLQVETFIGDSQSAVARGMEFIKKMRDLENSVLAGGELKPVDVSKVISTVIENYPKMKITTTGAASVVADEAITSVFDNIIGNVQMHSGSDVVNIEVNVSGKFVNIKIADEGKGIPDDVKVKLFTEGFKYGETGHSGLGLYIVRMTVERYGGSITVTDNTPKGAVFIVRLPKAD
ncbi:MAG TPA: HAMP domain-containing sensor histidine kinase [Patescibacteria group bacterium]|nr:HAMP domain-containing sensor histidine kinase [Patescibacteria group bacterium]